MGSWIRNVVLLVVSAVAFSGLAMADYYLRHEETGKTRRWLVGQGVALNADSAVQAAGINDRLVLESLERVGVDLGEPGASGETALMAAVEAGDVGMVEYLLGKGNVVQTLDHRSGGDDQTALLLALEGGDFSIAKKLIGAGAEMGSQWQEGVPLVVAAVKNDNAGLFGFLLAQGVSVKEGETGGLTALALAVKGRKDNWVSRLLDAGADANQLGESGEPLLLEAIRSGQRGLAKTLIDHGATVDGKNKVGETALMVVVEKADRGAITMLLDAGARVDVIDAKGRSISDRLMEGGDVSLVEFFLKESGEGITDEWMVKVFDGGKTGLLKGLLEKGGNVEAGAGKGGRLLKRAVLNKDRPMVELLLAFDADPKGEVWDALASGDQEILERLLAKGADANEALAVGVGSPLSLVLRQRRYDVVELLLLYGANPDPRQADGPSLIEDAASRGDERAVSILRDYCGDYHEEVYSEEE